MSEGSSQQIISPKFVTDRNESTDELSTKHKSPNKVTIKTNIKLRTLTDPTYIGRFDISTDR